MPPNKSRVFQHPRYNNGSIFWHTTQYSTCILSFLPSFNFTKRLFPFPDVKSPLDKMGQEIVAKRCEG